MTLVRRAWDTCITQHAVNPSLGARRVSIHNTRILRPRNYDLLRYTEIELNQAGSANTEKVLVGLGGFEPPTSPLSGVRSNQLSYRPKRKKANVRLCGGLCNLTLLFTQALGCALTN